MLLNSSLMSSSSYFVDVLGFFCVNNYGIHKQHFSSSTSMPFSFFLFFALFHYLSMISVHFGQQWWEWRSFWDGSVVKNLPAVQEMQETGVQPLGQEDLLEEGMATHSWSILAWRIPMDWGPWRVTVHRVAKTGTGLKWLSVCVHTLHPPRPPQHSGSNIFISFLLLGRKHLIF